MLYLAAGSSDDWAHLSGIMIAYTVELRDTGHYDFLLPASQILPMCEENIEGLRAIYKHIQPAGVPCNATVCNVNSKCIYSDTKNVVDCVCSKGYTRSGTECTKGN